MLLHRLCSDLRGRRVALLACAAVSFFPFSYVLSTNYSEGLFLLASSGAFTAARSRRSGAGVRGRARRRPHAAGGDPARDRPRRPTPCSRRSGGGRPWRAPWAPSPAWRIVFADLKRRRDDWLASLHAQQLGWHRSTSIVDAPGRARALHPRRDHARTRPEPALPDRRCRWPSSGWWCCGGAASATACSSTR